MIKYFGYMSKYPYLGIQKINGVYKFFIETYDSSSYTLRVYSLPGNGETEDVSTPIVHRHARKVLIKDQVYIESPDHIYDTQGKMVR